MRRHLGQLVIAGTFLALGSGCPEEVIAHPTSDEDNGSIFSSVGVVGGAEDFPSIDGNYPEPAVTRCGPVRGGADPIEGLASAWAVVALPGATANGEPLSTGSMRLRISEYAMDNCGKPLVPYGWGGSGSGSSSGSVGSTGFGASDQRGFELTLAPGEQTLGVHEVARLGDPGIATFGDGAAEETAAEGSIELLHVDDDCVIGIVRNFAADYGGPFMNGGFVAQTCQRQCISTHGDSC